MFQDNIRQKRDHLNGEMGRIKAKMKALQDECNHPEMANAIFHGGFPGKYCPDCEYSSELDSPVAWFESND